MLFLEFLLFCFWSILWISYVITTATLLGFPERLAYRQWLRGIFYIIVMNVSKSSDFKRSIVLLVGVWTYSELTCRMFTVISNILKCIADCFAIKVYQVRGALDIISFECNIIYFCFLKGIIFTLWSLLIYQRWSLLKLQVLAYSS